MSPFEPARGNPRSRSVARQTFHGSLFRGLAATATALALAHCSLLTDLDSLSRAPGSTALDAAGADASAAIDAADAEDGNAEGGVCTNKVRVRVVSRGGRASFMPEAAGTEPGVGVTRAPTIVVLTQYKAKDGASTMVLDRLTRPHVLVLASYDATSWVVDVGKPSALVKVVLSGYDSSTVTVPPATTIENTTPKTPHASNVPSTAATELLAHVRMVVGAETDVLAACYDPSSFELLDTCD